MKERADSVVVYFHPLSNKLYKCDIKNSYHCAIRKFVTGRACFESSCVISKLLMWLVCHNHSGLCVGCCHMLNHKQLFNFLVIV